MEPTVGRIVRYRLTRLDVKAINRRRHNATDHQGEHRSNANGVQVHVGNQHHVGDSASLLITKVWESTDPNPVAPDYIPGEEAPEFFEPLDAFSVNGQVFLDGNDTIWVTSVPRGDFNGGWDWPERV